MAEQPACPAIQADDVRPLPDSGVSADGRLSTLAGVITNPQVGSVDNSRRRTLGGAVCMGLHLPQRHVVRWTYAPMP